MLNAMIERYNTAIIVAAGSGSRLASDIPKQFLKLGDREILDYSVEAFLNHPKITEVVIVTSRKYMDHVVQQHPDCEVILGGETRQESVFNGLQSCSTATEVVLVHDAARPLIPGRVIDDCLATLASVDGVAPAMKPDDSMIEIEGPGFRNLPRHSLRIVQTPQCFHFNILKAAHASGKIDTDEIGLVKQANPGARLSFIDGAACLKKITRPQDIGILSQLLTTSEYLD